MADNLPTARTMRHGKNEMPYTPDTEPGSARLDVRDLIARYEELEASNSTMLEDDGVRNPFYDQDDAEEFDLIGKLLEELKGYGGDEQWRGDWYPISLIAEDDFENYAEELADDIGAIDRNASWPLSCIDWTQAASELQADYSSVEYGGTTYWYR